MSLPRDADEATIRIRDRMFLELEGELTTPRMLSDLRSIAEQMVFRVRDAPDNEAALQVLMEYLLRVRKKGAQDWIEKTAWVAQEASEARD